MAVVTLRPDGVDTAGSYTANGAASLNAATSDNSDSTSARLASATTSSGQVNQAGTLLRLAMTTFVLPALAQIRTITARARVAKGASGQRVASIGYYDPTTSTEQVGSVSPTTTIQTLAGSGFAPSAGSQNFLDNLLFELSAQAAFTPAGTYGVLAQLDLYEAYLDVLYNEAPVATPSSPTGTVTTTTEPTVQWAYSDPENDAQERYRVKVYSQAQYTLNGFNPEGWYVTGGGILPVRTVSITPIWDSGEVLSAATAVQIATSLANNTTYRAYVKVADAGSNGRYGAWAFSTFATNVASMAPPVLTATAISDVDRAQIAVQGQDNLLSTNQASLETDTTGWTAGANATIARTTAQAADGTSSLQITAAAAGTAFANTSPVLQPAVAGVTYTVLASFRPASTARAVNVIVRFKDGTGTLLTQVVGASVTEVAGSWVQAVVSAVAPAGTTQIDMVDSIAGCAASEVHYADKHSIAPGTNTVWTRGGLAGTQVIRIERSDDGGNTWVEIDRLADATGALLTYPLVLATGSQQATVYDWEATRDTNVQYRARSLGTESGNTFIGSYSTATPSITFAATTARLKRLYNPASSIAVTIESWSWPRQIPERVQFHEVAGRPDPVWVADVIELAQLSIPLFFGSDSAFDAFTAIRSTQEVLLLQTCWGDTGAEQFYIRLGADLEVTDETSDDMVTATKRHLTVSAREVATP